MKPFIKLLNEAAEDPDVVSIKMTLYRVADRSKIIEALIEAAENGKEVVVLVELRARFDEANNIGMSHRLEDAGCQILYGLGEYKVHSKLCLITKKNGDSFSYITQIGTGNYNEKTSRLYTDLSLMTADQAIGADAANVFMALQRGEVVEHSRIYRFGVGEEEKMYISSADFMTRNTLRRVEVAAPIHDSHIRERIRYMFTTMMADDVKGKVQTADGSYVDRHMNEVPVNSQEVFFADVYKE